MTIQLGDMVIIRQTSEKGRVMGKYPTLTGITYYIKTPNRDQALDVPHGHSVETYLYLSPSDTPLTPEEKIQIYHQSLDVIRKSTWIEICSLEGKKLSDTHQKTYHELTKVCLLMCDLLLDL